jgi:hypothetical protein
MPKKYNLEKAALVVRVRQGGVSSSKVIIIRRTETILWLILNGEAQLTILQFEDAGRVWPDS